MTDLFGSDEYILSYRNCQVIFIFIFQTWKEKSSGIAVLCDWKHLCTVLPDVFASDSSSCVCSPFLGTSVIQVTASDADDPTYGNSAKLVYSILEGQPYFSVEAQTGIVKQFIWVGPHNQSALKWIKCTDWVEILMCLSRASCSAAAWSPGICWSFSTRRLMLFLCVLMCCDGCKAVSVLSCNSPGLSSVWNIRAAFLTAMPRESRASTTTANMAVFNALQVQQPACHWTCVCHTSFVSAGIIRTALPNMDREAKEEYHVVIQAKDMGGHMGGLSGTTKVTITLTDVNDNPPKFPQSE